jgi:hypothetical protein
LKDDPEKETVVARWLITKTGFSKQAVMARNV